MKKIILLCLVGLWSSATFAKLSCDELDELATNLDELAEALEHVDNIGLNSELDDALWEVADVLTVVARVEDDARLTRWIADLKLAWQEMERADFEESLDDIIERLDDLGERDCSEW